MVTLDKTFGLIHGLMPSTTLTLNIHRWHTSYT